MKLLTIGNPKTLKGQSKGYLTFILHLAPSDLSGLGNTCPKATPGCRAACLNTAGRGGMFRKGETTNAIQQARIRRTVQFFTDREGFMMDLVADMEKAIRMCVKSDMEPVFRLNGTSDLSWEKYPVVRNGIRYSNIFDAFALHQFYDYTAVLGRKVKHIPNYHLTFSAKENNTEDVMSAMLDGMNVAVVFGPTLPQRWSVLGRPVIDGDESDLRFLDPKRVVIGLKAKGRAKKDKTGFVRWLDKSLNV